MTKGINALKVHNTWSIEELPLGTKPINYK